MVTAVCNDVGAEIHDHHRAGSSGSRQLCMCGRAYSPRFLWRWLAPRTKRSGIGVMGGEQAARSSRRRRDGNRARGGGAWSAEKRRRRGRPSRRRSASTMVARVIRISERRLCERCLSSTDGRRGACWLWAFGQLNDADPEDPYTSAVPDVGGG